MSWLERPASVYVDVEVVLHALPAVLVQKDGVTFEVQELRVHYRFDALKGRWEHRRTDAFGYRQQSRQGARVATPLPVGHADLVRAYAPRWIPYPSKPPSELTDREVGSAAISQETADLIRKVRGAVPASQSDEVRRG